MTQPTASASFLDDLSQQVAGASTDAGERARCAKDWSWPALYAEQQGTPKLPDVVVRATSDEDVAATLQARDGEPASRSCRAAAAPGSWGPRCRTRAGSCIDVSGMDEIVEIDEVSLTATVEAGMNGSEFERLLNERGLSFPHFPASAEWASVGGYVAARGSGVLSSRYGKIEDQVVAVRVVTPTGEIIDTIPVPRHAVGPELTQLFVGSEGTLGVITQVTVRLVPLPAYRRFEAVALPSLEAGIVGLRTTMQRGLRPAVIRFYDAEAAAGSLSPVVGQALDSATALLMFEGEQAVADAEAETALGFLSETGGTRLDQQLCRTWWEHRYDFYHPPHYPTLPVDVGHDRRGGAVRADRRRSTTRSARRSSRTRPTGSACGRTSATGTSGARWSTRAS